MINVVRPEEAPESLETPEIKKYIKDLADYLDDTDNLEKPKATESYRNSDLLEAFDECFYRKCYLTEQMFPNSWCMDVEHFIGQSEDPSKIYDWGNLYPADHKYNNMKPRKTPDGGYLDPCNPLDDVENGIIYSVGVYGQSPSFYATDNSDPKAINTANLLMRLHNGHDHKTMQSTAEIRHEIFKKYVLIQNLLIDWLGASDNNPIKQQYKIQLKEHLSRKSSFTMLMRSIVGVINHVPNDMLD